jgi:hypothetical protein
VLEFVGLAQQPQEKEMPIGDIHWKFCTTKLDIRCPYENRRKCPWDDTDKEGENWHTLHRPSAGRESLIPFEAYTFSEPEAVRYVRVVLKKMGNRFGDFRVRWGANNTEEEDRLCWNAHLSVDFASDIYWEFTKPTAKKYSELWSGDKEYQRFVTSVTKQIIETCCS